MTSTKRRYLVGRIVASAVVAALIGFALARAFAGGSPTPPPDDAAALIPRDALVYLNLGTDRSSSRWRRAADAMSKLQVVAQLRDALVAGATGGALGHLRLDRDVSPWLGDEGAYALLPGRPQRTLLVLKAHKPGLARRSIDGAAGSTLPETYRGVLLRGIGKGSVAGVAGGWAIVGGRDAVHAALDLRLRPAGSLAEDKAYHELTDGLPRDRLANGWLSGAWIGAHLAGPTRALAGLARAPGIRAAAVSFGDDGKRMRIAFRAQPVPGPGAGPGCTGERGQSGDLLSRAPAHPALFVGLAGAECLLRDLMASPGSAAGKALQSFSAQAQKVGVNVGRELLPLLGGDNALSVTPGRGAPTITLDAGGVPPQAGMNVLGRLQPALIDMVRPEDRGAEPGFSAQTVRGVTPLTAELTPALHLSYAALGGDLVVSTAMSGVVGAERGQHLDENKDFKLVLGDRPDSPSALVFLDLKKLLALADQAGLGSNPTYGAVRDDLGKIGAAGAVLAREGNDIDAELRLKNP